VRIKGEEINMNTLGKFWQRVLRGLKRGWWDRISEIGPDPEPAGDVYLVEPVLMLASDDFVLDAAKKIKEAFVNGSLWWKEKTGKTFNVGEVKIHRSLLTRAELEAKGPGNNIWDYLQYEAGLPEGVIDNYDDHKAHYAVIPFLAAGGGMRGSEHFGAEHILPGKAAISGKEALVLLGDNPTHYGYDAPVWWFDEVREATGALMHELGHVFGNGVDQPLDHKDGTIMFGYWDYPNATFDLEQQSILDGSPFLT
jgi:hypothetical protein